MQEIDQITEQLPVLSREREVQQHVLGIISPFSTQIFSDAQAKQFGGSNLLSNKKYIAPNKGRSK